MDEEYDEEVDTLQEEELKETIVYDVLSQPRKLPDGRWYLDMLWATPETGQMGEGQLNPPTLEAAEEICKHFRTSVEPLTNEKLTEIYSRPTGLRTMQ